MDTDEFSPERREAQFRVLQAAQAQVLNLCHWHQFLGTLSGAGFRSAEMISSQMALLYAYAFYLIGRNRFHVARHTLDTLIGRWFFASSLTGRYTGSAETVMDGDLNRIKAVHDADGFVRVLEEIMSSTLTNDFWRITLPTILDSSSARNPALFAFIAAQIRLGAPVLFSHNKVANLFDPTVQPRRKALERHHLFPRGWLEKRGVTDLKLINQMANFTLLEWTDNLDISDTPPSVYAPAIRKERSISNDYWKTMCELHALPGGWENMDYPGFLERRRKLMAAIIRRGFETLR